jgi:hypothetical protein
MRHGGAFMLVAALLACPAAGASVNYDVTRSGRKIQLDGYLPEWSSAYARQLDGMQTIRWDAMITPEGLAGYFAVDSIDTCAAWKFRLFPDLRVLHRYLEIDARPGAEAAHYAVARAGSHGVVAEWLVPAGDIKADSAGRFRIGLSGVGACGDTFPAITISGVKNAGKVRLIFTPMMKAQILLILMLLTSYFWIRSRVTKPSRRRE